LYKEYFSNMENSAYNEERASTETIFFDAPENAQDASGAVFDTAIALVTIFHMIEWLRQTVFITSTLVNVNLMPLYNVLSLNIPFGFIAMLFGIAIRFSEDGNDCAMENVQMERGRYLSLQIICIFLYIPMMFAHVILFKVKGV
jgi:hypothetical protein